jgi:RNA polymerase sigma-70 factor (ECF subfamily)
VIASPPSSAVNLADPDAELVGRAQRGDLAAFEQLVERHRDVVFRVAARVVGPEDAEDVSQDAFLRAFHRLDRFRGEGNFRSWLLQIAHNAALTAIGRRHPEPIEEIEQLDSEPQEGERSPASRLESSERRTRLESKIRLLRPEHRAVLVLRDVEGLSYEEVGRVTEMPIGSVKGRLHRARDELIDLLRRNTYDWDLPE